MNDFSQWKFVWFQLRIIDRKHIQSKLDMFDQDKTNLQKWMIFRTEILFAFNYEFMIINTFNFRLDMLDQDKKDLKIMTGIESTNSY